MCYFAGASLPGKVTLARGVARGCRFFFPPNCEVCVRATFFGSVTTMEGIFFFFFKRKKRKCKQFSSDLFSRSQVSTFFFFLFKKRNIFIPAVFMSLFCPVVTCSAPVIWIPVLHPIAAFWFISVSSLLPFLRVFFFSWPSFHVARNRPILVVWFWGDFLKLTT